MIKVGGVLDGRYRVLRELGQGGGGIIFQAYHMTLQKYVVIKKIKDEKVKALDVRKEADILKKLHHPYLPQVYDFLIVDREVFTVMDFIDGHDLRWYMDSGILFSEQQLLRMLLELCDVLEYLHGQRPPIIHRDIKPGNIMIRENGEICLIDFNISFSENGGRVGGYSYYFAPPEQLSGSGYVPDVRGDVYSLGATFFYVMTGVRPRESSLKSTVVENAYSKGLFRIIRKAMEKQPEKRYQNIGQMRRALERQAEGAYRLVKPLAGAAGLLVVLLLGMALVLWRREKQEALFAQQYSAYVLAASSEDGAERVTDGLEILNTEGFARILKQRPKQKAVILEEIADGYFAEENYSSAASYYAEAAQIQPDSIGQMADVRDQILALIRSGNLEEAGHCVEEDGRGLSNETLQYIEAEFLVAEDEKEAALKQMDQLLESGQERDLLLRCCLYGAQYSRETEGYDRELVYLKRAEAYADTLEYNRKIGDLFLDIWQSDTKKARKQEALAGAERCYQKVCQDQNAGYVDRLNLAMILEMRGSYRDALELLKALVQTAPEDYRAYREAAFVLYGQEQQKPLKNRAKEPILYYGRLAQQYYGDRTDDEQMEQLKAMLERLQGK